MYLSIIVLPLLASVASGLFGRKIGVSGAQLVTSLSITITTILSIIVFFEVGMNNIPVCFSLFRWIDSETLNIFWGFRFDSLTVSMLIPVLIISSLVHIYSVGYMRGDPHNQRFFSYLSLFTFMMIILVTANNFLLMFVGWEGVGICSYLLVNFWFTRIAANQSSISALLTNRVGDCLLTVGMFAILWSFGNIDYSTVFSSAPFISENIVTIIGICLLIGAMAKSSQIGLHVWLPMAMEGPTPVSALIHAATMVTAGVYLLMRSSPLIEYSSTTLILCLWIGAITTIFSSLIGLFQQDIKKVIAYSTMSQLGMMVIAVGLSSYNIALFHLINHAFYKALLFLAAGSVIHAISDNQDFRKYGGLKPFLPLTYSVIMIASLSLIAFPFMTGFYSKDFILETGYGQFSFSSIIIYYIAIIGAIFTTLYSIKILYLTFITNPNGSLVDYKKVHEGDIYMSLPLIILAIFSIFFGFIVKDIFLGLGSNFFVDNSLFIHPSKESVINTEFAVNSIFKLLPLICTILFSFISIIFSEFFPIFLLKFKFNKFGYNVFSFFNQRFFIELFYNKFVTNIILKLGGQTTKVLDKGSIEYFGPFGLEKFFINLSIYFSKLDKGIVTSYALYILIGFIFYICISYIYTLNINYILLIYLTLIGNYYRLYDNKFNTNRGKHGFVKRNLEGNLFLHFLLANYIFKCVLITYNYRVYIVYSPIKKCYIILKKCYINLKKCYIILNIWADYIDSVLFIKYMLFIFFIERKLDEISSFFKIITNILSNVKLYINKISHYSLDTVKYLIIYFFLLFILSFLISAPIVYYIGSDFMSDLNENIIIIFSQIFTFIFLLTFSLVKVFILLIIVLSKKVLLFSKFFGIFCMTCGKLAVNINEHGAGSGPNYPNPDFGPSGSGPSGSGPDPGHFNQSLVQTTSNNGELSDPDGSLPSIRNNRLWPDSNLVKVWLEGIEIPNLGGYVVNRDFEAPVNNMDYTGTIDDMVYPDIHNRNQISSIGQPIDDIVAKKTVFPDYFLGTVNNLDGSHVVRKIYYDHMMVFNFPNGILIDRSFDNNHVTTTTPFSYIIGMEFAYIHEPGVAVFNSPRFQFFLRDSSYSHGPCPKAFDPCKVFKTFYTGETVLPKVSQVRGAYPVLEGSIINPIDSPVLGTLVGDFTAEQAKEFMDNVPEKYVRKLIFYLESRLWVFESRSRTTASDIGFYPRGCSIPDRDNHTPDVLRCIFAAFHKSSPDTWGSNDYLEASINKPLVNRLKNFIDNRPKKSVSEAVAASTSHWDDID